MAKELELLIQRRAALLDRKSRLEEKGAPPESMPLLMEKMARMMESTDPRGDIIKLLVDKVVITAEGGGSEKEHLVSVFYRFQKQ